VNRFGLVSALFLGCALLLIVTMNPCGNLPVHAFAFASHAIMDTNDRYQYRSIVRSGEFDSAVIGTASSRLLELGCSRARSAGVSPI
jgi:hypothetical protein